MSIVSGCFRNFASFVRCSLCFDDVAGMFESPAIDVLIVFSDLVERQAGVSNVNMK